QVLSVMLTCGMYDNAGDWVSDLGLPAKSGVGGGIIAALPSRFGVASYAPQLDLHGNSVRGTLFFERFSTDFALHMLDGVEPRDLEEGAQELVEAGARPGARGGSASPGTGGRGGPCRGRLCAARRARCAGRPAT